MVDAKFEVFTAVKIQTEVLRLKIDAAMPSEMLATYRNTILRHKPEYLYLSEYGGHGNLNFSQNT
jgi:hypothetical protein